MEGIRKWRYVNIQITLHRRFIRSKDQRHLTFRAQSQIPLFLMKLWGMVLVVVVEEEDDDGEEDPREGERRAKWGWGGTSSNFRGQGLRHRSGSEAMVVGYMLPSVDMQGNSEWRRQRWREGQRERVTVCTDTAKRGRNKYRSEPSELERRITSAIFKSQQRTTMQYISVVYIYICLHTLMYFKMMMDIILDILIHL